MRALTLLSLWQIKNALRTTFTDVRKLIPILVMAFALGMQVLSLALVSMSRPRMRSGADAAISQQAGSVIAQHLDQIGFGAFVILTIIAIGILDYGFQEGFLAFSLADVDYLFTAPVSRRLVMAYRLAGKTAIAFFQASFFFYFVLRALLETMARGRASPLGAVMTLLALFFCIGGYANVAFTLKLIFGFGQAATVRRWFLALAALLAVLLGWTFWQGTTGGLGPNTQLAWVRVVVVLFYPCRLAADAVLALLQGGAGTFPTALLALFYGLSLALLFSRNEHFYEASLAGSERAAKMIQAARDQNWGAMFGIGAERKRRAPAPANRPYVLPPFGRGGGALLWANLSAAAKRPFPNFIAPVLGGAALSVVASRLLPPVAAAPVVGGISAYLLFLLTTMGVNVFRQSLQRQALVRPLPLPAWQVVAADVAPHTLISSLFGWSAGFTLLFARVPNGDLAALLLIVCLPVLLVCLDLVQYILALWYPDAQDKLQQMLAGFISLFLTGTVLTLLGGVLAIPLFLRAPLWVVALAFVLPAMAAAAGLLFAASWVYRWFQPKQ